MSQWYEERKPFDAESAAGPAEEPRQQWPGGAATQPYAAEDDVSVEDAAPAGLEPEPVPEPAAEQEREAEPEPVAELQHVSGGLEVPDGYNTIEAEPRGERRAVAVVVGRFNGEITSGLLQQALDELQLHGVSRANITVVPVPGAFELPLAVMALAKTRRYACIVALGCVIRGETPHFDFVATEAASGLQLAALETGTPIAFGVLTTETAEQARDRITRGADAARSALEMAEVFTQLRAASGS
jgi:6,7-dimethyl-8-ribityllumazine synthase